MINDSSAQTDSRLAGVVSGGRQKAIFEMFSSSVFRPTNGPEHSGQSWRISDYTTYQLLKGII